MHRFSHRFTAASIAAVLLLAPVAVQAAPADRVACAGWGAALLAGLETALHDTWSTITAALGVSTEEPSDGSGDEVAEPDGFAASTTSEPDDDSEMRPGWDPNG